METEIESIHHHRDNTDSSEYDPDEQKTSSQSFWSCCFVAVVAGMTRDDMKVVAQG